MNGPRTALRSSLSDRERRKAATDSEHSRSVRNDLSRFSGRVEDGPGGVGSTSQGLTHPDRLNRSEGCREGYPPRPNPNHWFHPVNGKNFPLITQLGALELARDTLLRPEEET